MVQFKEKCEVNKPFCMCGKGKYFFEYEKREKYFYIYLVGWRAMVFVYL